MAISNLENYPGGPVAGQTRVRFAPSPTGSLHVGGARSHLFNWLFAKHENGKLVVRVEDTDQVRSTPEFERMVMRDIESLELIPDESPDHGGDVGPYRQSERIENYSYFATKLLSEGKAYRCFCPEELLDEKAKAAKAAGKPPHYDGTCTHLSAEESEKRAQSGEEFAIRMIAPPKDYSYEDFIRGTITFKQGMVGDFVLVRSNGLPVYNFAVVVDDYLMNISHIIRGEDHISNTLRQMMILEGLGWEMPIFAHISLVLGDDRKKLSKRHGVTSVDEYLKQGYLKEALVNFLALLGWSHPEAKEIMPIQEIVDNFVLKKLTKSPAIFDTEKLQWMNGEYIRSMDLKELAQRIRPFVEKAGFDMDKNGEQWFLDTLSSVRGHLRLLTEVGPHLEIFYPETYKVEDSAREWLKEEHKPGIDCFRELLQEYTGDLSEAMQALPKAVKEKSGIKGKNLFMPLRAAITGRLEGPELKLVLPLIGKDEAVRRLSTAF